MPKRLLHLITSLEGGGTENFLYQILQHSPDGYDHTVVYLKKDGVIGERIRKIGIPVKPAGSFFNVYSILRNLRPNILHTCLYSAHILGRCFGRLAGVPAIITSQRSIDIWQAPWQTTIDRFTLPWSSAVIVNSRAAESVIRKRRREDNHPPTYWIPNGIDLSRFQGQDRVLARTKYRLPPDAIVGGSLMRLHPEKGSDFIPAFASRVFPGRPKLHLLIGGLGPLETQIKSALRGTDYVNRIHFVGWEENTPAFLAASDFFWSLSREESFPQTLVEAAAMGLPWIAPDTGGVSELLAQGAVGSTFPRLDIFAAASQTTALIENLAALSQNASQSAEKIRSAYALNNMVKAVYEVFGRF